MGTRGQWARDFLAALGNNNPTAATIRLVAAWTAVENTLAKFNPLATTLDYGTNTNFNRIGVKNYESRQQGIQASVMSLGNNPGFPQLKKALASNDVESAFNSGAFDTWGSHTAKVRRIYNERDSSNENLRAEDSYTSNSGDWSLPPEMPPKTDERPQDDSTKETDYMNPSAEIAAEDIRSAVFIVVGSVCFIVSIVLVMRVAANTDAAKLATKAVTKGVL